VQTARNQRPSGLPAEVSSLVGRGPQIAAVLERLHTARIVTLTGPGGCGKTRLALRAAALAEARFGDGARLAELAPLTDPALVPASVAQALEVPERDATSPAAALVRMLADREVLIVLDNCEHVLQAAASLVVTLLERCRGVRILATSRERLDVPGEFVFPVPPLALPQDGSAQAVAASEAGLLFTARPARPIPHLTLLRQRGGDRRAVRPPRWHATGHRIGGGPVPGPRPRATRRAVGRPPRTAIRRPRPAGPASVTGGVGGVEL
jgi:hypothetical protein